MAMAVAVVDDDEVQNEYLRKLVKEWADGRGIAVDVRGYGSAEEFLFDYEDRPCSLLLLDIEMEGQNGMELARKLRARVPEEERFIRVFIGIIKGQFYLSIQNAAGEMKKKGAGYLSTKRDGEAYGYGLFRIDRIANKYKGFVNRQGETGVFATELTFPIADGGETVGAK